MNDRFGQMRGKDGYTQDDNRTKAYAGWVSPENFVKATTPADERGRLESEAAPLDVEELAGQSQEIFLEGRIDPDSGLFTVNGHEGRHRKLALAEAGITNLPVVYYVGVTNDAEPTKSLFATPQVYRHAKAEGGFLTGLMPISWAYNNELKERSAPTWRWTSCSARRGCRRRWISAARAMAQR